MPGGGLPSEHASVRGRLHQLSQVEGATRAPTMERGNRQGQGLHDCFP